MRTARHQGGRGLRWAAISALCAATLAISAAPAQAFEPIEGSWFFEGGEVRVEATGPGKFVGIVVKPTRFANCTHPAGQRMWDISGGGTHYTGTHIWYFDGTCGENPGGESTWDIVSTDPAKFQLRFCTEAPGRGPPTASTQCDILTRSRPPEPRVAPNRVIRLPSSKRCRSRRSFRIRIRQPKGVVLASATVTVNGRRVRLLKGRRLRAPVNLRGLPKGRWTVRIRVVTAAGRVLTGTRRYRTCVPKRRGGRTPRL